MKIVIGDDPPEPDMSHHPGQAARHARPSSPTRSRHVKDKSVPTFELQRGSSSADPEYEWLINGLAFDPGQADDLASSGLRRSLWRIRNGGGGWVHPFHLHMEEHRVIARNGKPAPDARHPDDSGKEDVVALDPSEEVVISRRFRTFTGPTSRTATTSPTRTTP